MSSLTPSVTPHVFVSYLLSVRCFHDHPPSSDRNDSLYDEYDKKKNSNNDDSPVLGIPGPQNDLYYILGQTIRQC